MSQVNQYPVFSYNPNAAASSLDPIVEEQLIAQIGAIVLTDLTATGQPASFSNLTASTLTLGGQDVGSELTTLQNSVAALPTTAAVTNAVQSATSGLATASSVATVSNNLQSLATTVNGLPTQSQLSAALSSTSSTITAGNLTAGSITVPGLAFGTTDLHTALANLTTGEANLSTQIGNLNGAVTTFNSPANVAGSVLNSIQGALSSTSSSVSVGALTAGSSISTPALTLAGNSVGTTLAGLQSGQTANTAQINTNKSNIASNTTAIQANAASISTLGGSALTNGSVLYSVANAAQVGNSSTSITAGSLTLNGTSLSTTLSGLQSAVNTNANNLSNLSSSLNTDTSAIQQNSAAIGVLNGTSSGSVTSTANALISSALSSTSAISINSLAAGTVSTSSGALSLQPNTGVVSINGNASQANGNSYQLVVGRGGGGGAYVSLVDNGSGLASTLHPGPISAARTLTMPDQSGTLAVFDSSSSLTVPNAATVQGSFTVGGSSNLTNGLTVTGNLTASASSALSFTPGSTLPFAAGTSATGNGFLGTFLAPNNTTSGNSTSLGLGTAIGTGTAMQWNYISASSSAPQTMGPVQATSPFQSFTCYSGTGAALYLGGVNQPIVCTKYCILDDNSGNPTFNSQATSSTYVNANFYAPKLAPGNCYAMNMGVNPSTSQGYNAAQFLFNYAGAGSTNNNLTLGFVNKNVLNLTAGGKITSSSGSVLDSGSGAASIVGALTVGGSSLTVNSSATAGFAANFLQAGATGNSPTALLLGRSATTNNSAILGYAGSGSSVGSRTLSNPFAYLQLYNASVFLAGDSTGALYSLNSVIDDSQGNTTLAGSLSCAGKQFSVTASAGASSVLYHSTTITDASGPTCGPILINASPNGFGTRSTTTGTSLCLTNNPTQSINTAGRFMADQNNVLCCDGSTLFNGPIYAQNGAYQVFGCSAQNPQNTSDSTVSYLTLGSGSNEYQPSSGPNTIAVTLPSTLTLSSIVFVYPGGLATNTPASVSVNAGGQSGTVTLGSTTTGRQTATFTFNPPAACATFSFVINNSAQGSAGWLYQVQPMALPSMNIQCAAAFQSGMTINGTAGLTVGGPVQLGQVGGGYAVKTGLSTLDDSQGNATLAGHLQLNNNTLLNSAGNAISLPSSAGTLALTSQVGINAFWYQAYTVNASGVLSSQYTTYSPDNGASCSMSGNQMAFSVPGVYLMRVTASCASVAAGAAWTTSIPTTSGLTAYPASYAEYNDSGLNAHAVAASWESIISVTAACQAAFVSSITNQVVNVAIQLKRVS